MGVYALTVLGRLVAKCRSLPEIRQAIDAYPEDSHREGHVRAEMSAFVSGFASFDPLVQAVRALAASHGGQAALDDLQDPMEFDEFMAGWDDEK